jgi:two-component system, cell cycle response regulator DivK
MTRILLVEDNEMNRDMLSRRLSRRGFEVLIAENGQSGVDLTVSERPDLVLMDMSLPVMDGWEATRRIKANDALKHIPIIAVTSHAMVGDEVEARKAGCDDYLSKPIDEDALMKKIKHFLG